MSAWLFQATVNGCPPGRGDPRRGSFDDQAATKHARARDKPLQRRLLLVLTQGVRSTISVRTMPEAII